MFQVKFTFDDKEDFYVNVEDEYVEEYLNCCLERRFFKADNRQFFIDMNKVRHCEVYKIEPQEPEEEKDEDKKEESEDKEKSNPS